MNTLQEWAEWYKSLKVWVYPYMSEEQPWKFWKSKKDKDYETLYCTWSWNNDAGIKLVVGKKGLRVIELHDKELLNTALSSLGLPDDYPWVIEKEESIAVIVDVPSVSTRVKGMSNRNYENLSVLWEGYYVLPSVNSDIHFYRESLPTKHPIQIEDDEFIDCIENLQKGIQEQNCEENKEEETEEEKDQGWSEVLHFLKWAAIIFCIFLVSNKLPQSRVLIAMLAAYVGVKMVSGPKKQKEKGKED